MLYSFVEIVGIIDFVYRLLLIIGIARIIDVEGSRLIEIVCAQSILETV